VDDTFPRKGYSSLVIGDRTGSWAIDNFSGSVGSSLSHLPLIK
jgi:hypothetical protein